MKGTIQLEGRKEFSRFDWAIYRPEPPGKVWVSLQQGKNQMGDPVVRVGDRVRAGEKIAEPKSGDGPACHASISGKVTSLGLFTHPYQGEAPAVEIQNDGKGESFSGVGSERSGWPQLTPREILGIFRESGLWRGGWKGGALHTAIANTRDSTENLLVVSGLEPEPYLSSQYALVMSHPLEVLKGSEIVRRAAQKDRVLIIMGEDQLQAAELLKSKIYFLKWEHVEVRVMAPRYPLHHELLLGELFGGVTVDAAEVFAAYEAVALQKPFYERVMTVAGECVVQPRNVCVKLGTLVEEVLRSSRNFLRPPRKVLLGGVMTGEALALLGVPVLKGSEAVLALPGELARPRGNLPCIRCGDCLDVCPAGISPALISVASERNLPGLVRSYGADLCIECGNCAYVCPSERPMVELIKRFSDFAEV